MLENHIRKAFYRTLCLKNHRIYSLLALNTQVSIDLYPACLDEAFYCCTLTATLVSGSCRTANEAPHKFHAVLSYPSKCHREHNDKSQRDAYFHFFDAPYVVLLEHEYVVNTGIHPFYCGPLIVDALPLVA